MKHRTITEVIIGMRSHVEKLLRFPEARELEELKTSFTSLSFEKVPDKRDLDYNFEMLLKKEVFGNQSLVWDFKNTHWVAWACATQCDALYKQLKRGT